MLVTMLNVFIKTADPHLQRLIQFLQLGFLSSQVRKFCGNKKIQLKTVIVTQMNPKQTESLGFKKL